MDERLAVADAALKAGRAAEAIELLIAVVEDNAAQPLGVYRVLLLQLYQAGRYAEAETWSALAVQRHPRDPELWNIRGVTLRKLGRSGDAIPVFEQAIKLNAGSVGAQSNLGNVLLDQKLYARAEAVFAKLARKEPRNSEYHRQLGRAARGQGKREAGLMRFRQAIAVNKNNVDAWLDLISAHSEEGIDAEAEDLTDRAIAANPGAITLLECKATVIRRAGQYRRAEAFLLELMPQYSEAEWLHYQLGTIISDFDRERGNTHMRKALELAPEKLNYRMALIESLERTRTGDESANIEEAYQLLLPTLDSRVAEFGPSALKVAYEVLTRVADYDSVGKLGAFKELGRVWAETDRHTAFLKILGQVRTLEDRYELLEEHRIWGRAAEAVAARRPVRRPPKRAVGQKVRVGFMSSDLRRHPVAYFAMPLFQHYDRERFEIYCYSYYQGAEDDIQAEIKQLSTAFRWNPDISDRDAAQLIADDDLDMLIELGGSTHMNKLTVMAYKPSPLSASWVGYPFSAGLETIDYLVTDPYLLPEQPGLMIEKPLTLPHAWYALGYQAFRAEPAVNPQSPFERNGFITFGTANQPYKYSAYLLEAWAGVLNAVPGSQFLFVRPEGNAASFTANIRKEFAKWGVDPQRIRFETIRGRHLPFYNEMDISLDTFPQTGGTTTCESLWMGVPVITLVGPTMFERLSYSVLMNLDLADLCARTPAEYVAAAAALAHDRPRLNELRRTLRSRMTASHLGQAKAFATDYLQAVEDAVRQGATAASSPRDSSIA